MCLAPLYRWMLVAPTLILGTMASVHAQAHTGQVSIYHLNAANVAYKERGACIQMTPEIPERPWACLWKSNPLYMEMNALLLTSHLSKSICTLTFSNNKDGEGHWQIAIVHCQQPEQPLE